MDNENITEVKSVRVRDFVVECPFCSAVHDGWATDPRGHVGECDECGKAFKVADNPEVTF